jgi:hypothetical protein
MFEEHYKGMKKSLDLINKHKNLEEIRTEKSEMITEDMASLFNPRYNSTDRADFLLKNEPDIYETQGIYEYTQAVSKITYDQDCHNISIRSFHSINNVERYKTTIDNSLKYVNDIENHPRFEEVKQLISGKLNDLSEQELRIITYFAENHEQATLLTLEPRLLGILGLGLFLNIFLPIHASGNFTIIVKETIKNKILKISKLQIYFEETSDSLDRIYKRITLNIKPYHPIIRFMNQHPIIHNAIIGTVSIYFIYLVI